MQLLRTSTSNIIAVRNSLSGIVIPGSLFIDMAIPRTSSSDMISRASHSRYNE